ncbi:MAG: response regulator, partial [Anaerolineae bacterium]
MEETHTILVVEDEATLREALVYNLNKEGYAVSQASTGLQALALARTLAPDVIILDLMLPELDGLSVCRSLRREPATADCSILILTARGGELDKIIGLETGADDYLTKPFSLGELLARVRALLRRTRSSAPRDT